MSQRCFYFLGVERTLLQYVYLNVNYLQHENNLPKQIVFNRQWI